MEFEILGAVRALDGGRAQALAPMPRLLLAVLLCHRNRTVSPDLLADALWGGKQVPNAGKKVRLHVHRLRKALDSPDRLQFAHGGYTLRVDPGELDADRFDTLAAEGMDEVDADPHDAATVLGTALDLWGGPVFGDLGDNDALTAEAERLTERRLAAAEARYTAELAAGRHAAVLPDLTALVGEHPFRERLHGLLMQALAGSGRQAEALEAYQRARRVFQAELGLEPGPELRRLEHAILAGETCQPPAGTQPPAPAQLPPDIADFTGQDRLVRQVNGLLRERNGTVAVSAIAGAGGIGKTALAVHVAHALRGEFPDGQLYVNLRGVEEQPVPPAEALARFLRALGVDGSAIPADVDERGQLYRSYVADRRMLVVLDNAADEQQVAPLLPSSPGCAVIVTSRARLAALPGAHLVDVDVLAHHEALALLARIVGADRVAAEPDAAARLVRQCGFLPLAVRIAGARLAARPHWTLASIVDRLADDDGRRRLDELAHGALTVRASIALSYRGLSPDAARMFRLLSTLTAPDFPVLAGAAALDVTEGVAERLIEQLADMRLLEVAGRDPVGQTRYRFHDLVRIYAREQAVAAEPAPERIAATGRVSGYLLHLAEEGYRRVHGGDYHILHGTAPRWRPSHASTDRLLADHMAWYEAERLALVAAVEQTAAAGLDELCWDLAMSSAGLFYVRNYYDDWLATNECALAAAKAAGNRRGEAVMLFTLALFHHPFRPDYADTRAMCDRALRLFAEVDDEHGTALVRCVLTFLECRQGHLTEAMRIGEASLAGLRAYDDRCGAGYTLNGLGIVHMRLGEPRAAERRFAEALESFGTPGCPHGSTRSGYWLGQLYLDTGRVREAEDAFRHMLAAARRIRDRRAELHGRYGLGITLRSQHAAETETALRAALDLATETGHARIEAEIRALLDGTGTGHGRLPYLW